MTFPARSAKVSNIVKPVRRKIWRGEHWLVVWGEDRARFWDTTTGLPLSPWLNYGQLIALSLNDNSLYLLTKSENAVSRRRIGIKNDWPTGRSSLVIELKTGTRLTEFGQMKPLTVKEWQERMSLYRTMTKTTDTTTEDDREFWQKKCSEHRVGSTTENINS